MKLQEGTDSSAQWNNAQFLAAASDFAYLSDAEGREQFQSVLGMEARAATVGHTQAFVAQSPDAVVVAFRGTQSPTSLDGFKDCLLSDANDFLIIPEGRIGTDFAAAGVGARFHRGFMQALADVWDPVYAAVTAEIDRQERPLWLTGHSLGGAMALLAAWRFLRQGIAVCGVYTFGAPMVGNAAAVQAFDKELNDKVFRFVHEPDLVPRLPTVSLMANSYGHCLKEVLIAPGKAAGSAVSSSLDVIKQMAGAAQGAVLEPSIVDKLWGHVTDRLGDHAIANYRARIEERCKSQG
jgi:triacylglycerol lipase